MNTHIKVYSLDHVSLKMESDWSKGELLDTKVFIFDNVIPGVSVHLTTIAGGDIPQFLRTFKLMLKTFAI